MASSSSANNNNNNQMDLCYTHQPPRPNTNTYWVTNSLLAGEHPTAKSSQEMTRAKLRAYLACGITHFVDLTHEGERQDYEMLVKEEASNLGRSVTYQRFVIPDFGVPHDARLMTDILNAMDNAIHNENSNQKVYVHCRGGIGRTGTTVGCYLARHGYSGQEALDKVNQLFQRHSDRASESYASPETCEQMDFVRQWKE